MFEVVPERGAIVTSFLAAAGREVFYLDRTTLADPTKNVRGGCPVLFPSPGKLEPPTMKQHGFARDLPWERTGDEHTYVLRSNDVTRAQYPWDFEVTLRYRARGDTLRIEHRVEHTGPRTAKPMPFAFGFHPYFRVAQADKAATRITTKATRAFDNVTKRVVPFTGFDLASREVDLHLQDHGSNEASLVTPDGFTVTVRASPEYRTWVVWTVEGKDYVCLEPWTAPGNALVTGQDLVVLAPGEAREMLVEITGK